MSKKTSWEVEKLSNGDFRVVKGKNTTEILFILDRSTSMRNISQEAVNGFNAFLEEQQQNPKGKRLTLLLFDTNLEYIYKNKKIKKCKPLVNRETYVTQGCTALLDAIGTGLEYISKSKKAIVAIYTDGQENISQRFDSKNVKLALHKAEKKGWETLFLAAEIGTDFAIDTLGISALKCATVNKVDIGDTMRTLSTYTTNYTNSGKSSNNNLQDDIDLDISS